MTSSQAIWALLAIMGVQAITGSAILMLGRQSSALQRALPFLVSGAAGVLLATVCLDLLPEAARTAGQASGAWITLLLSLLVLFCLSALADGMNDADHHHPESVPMVAPASEFAADRHLHAPKRAASAGLKAGPLLLGSALHSAADGIAIAAAFAAGSGPGWTAAIAVGLHELPHRLGDFSLLLHRGIPRRRAAEYAIGAGAMALVGGIAVVALGQYVRATRWLLPVSAATFLYIALVDLVPELQAHRKSGRVWWEIACLLGGAAVIAALTQFSGE